MHWHSPSRLDWGTVCLSVSASAAHGLPCLAFFLFSMGTGLEIRSSCLPAKHFSDSYFFSPREESFVHVQ